MNWLPTARPRTESAMETKIDAFGVYGNPSSQSSDDVASAEPIEVEDVLTLLCRDMQVPTTPDFEPPNIPLDPKEDLVKWSPARQHAAIEKCERLLEHNAELMTEPSPTDNNSLSPSTTHSEKRKRTRRVLGRTGPNNTYGRSGKARCDQCRKWRQKVRM